VRTPAGAPSPGARKADDGVAELRNYLLTGKITNAQSENVPSQGGYLVPDEFRVKLIERLKAFGGLGSVAERYSTGTGAPGRVADPR
jgi:HK97 family phage major capsid protein